MFRVARLRVTAGFVLGALGFWLAAPSWASIAAGGVLALAGEAIRVWAAGHLEKGTEVTSSGPYRYVRHPLYVGSSLIGVGFAVTAAHLPVALAVFAYLAATLTAAMRLEEATLRTKFGADYARYAQGGTGASDRGFSLRRAFRNGEHLAVLGLLGGLALMSAKVWWPG